jgi:hypothetical protein
MPVRAALRLVGKEGYRHPMIIALSCQLQSAIGSLLAPNRHGVTPSRTWLTL